MKGLQCSVGAAKPLALPRAGRARRGVAAHLSSVEMSAHDDDEDYDEEEKETGTNPPASKSKPLLRSGREGDGDDVVLERVLALFWLLLQAVVPEALVLRPHAPRWAAHADGAAPQAGAHRVARRRARAAHRDQGGAHAAGRRAEADRARRRGAGRRAARGAPDRAHARRRRDHRRVHQTTVGREGRRDGRDDVVRGPRAFAAHGIGQQGFKIDRQCDYVLPVASQPAPLPSQSLAAAWNEPIDVHTSYKSLLDPNVLFLFEIVDFGPNISVKDARKRNGVSAIAWAFLRPVSSDGQINIALRSSSEDDDVAPLARETGDQATLNRPLRLQLYKFCHSRRSRANRSVALLLRRARALARARAHAAAAAARPQAHLWAIDSPPPPVTSNVPAVFVQFLHWRRQRYPSTLAVKLAPVRCPAPIKVPRRPRVPTEREFHPEKAQIGESPAPHARARAARWKRPRAFRVVRTTQEGGCEPRRRRSMRQRRRHSRTVPRSRTVPSCGGACASTTSRACCPTDSWIA